MLYACTIVTAQLQMHTQVLYVGHIRAGGNGAAGTAMVVPKTALLEF